MSNESLQKVYDAAQLFIEDTSNIDGLRSALKAHDGEKGEQTPDADDPNAESLPMPSETTEAPAPDETGDESTTEPAPSL